MEQKKFKNHMRVTPERMKIIQMSAFDGLEKVKGKTARMSRMQERHQEILDMLPYHRQNPIAYAQRVMRAQGMESAARIAAGMMHIIKKLPKQRSYDKRNMIFWQNVYGYIQNRSPKKFIFSEEVLNRFHGGNLVPFKKQKQIEKQIEKTEAKAMRKKDAVESNRK